MKKIAILSVLFLSSCVAYPGPGYAPAPPGYASVDYTASPLYGWYGRRYISAPGRWHNYESPHMRGDHGEAPAHNAHAHSEAAHRAPTHSSPEPAR